MQLKLIFDTDMNWQISSCNIVIKYGNLSIKSFKSICLAVVFIALCSIFWSTLQFFVVGEMVGGKKRKATEDREEEARQQPVGRPSSVTAASGVEGGSKKAAAASSSNPYVNERTVYVEGLPFSATEEQISQFFSECGPTKSIRLPRWHDSGRLRGYGHVEFNDSEAAQKAFELDGKRKTLFFSFFLFPFSFFLSFLSKKRRSQEK